MSTSNKDYLDELIAKAKKSWEEEVEDSVQQGSSQESKRQGRLWIY